MHLLTYRLIVATLVTFTCYHINGERYTADWKSLDARPLPSWYDEAKLGIFLHWGVFSVPSFGSEWFWHALNNKEKPTMEFMARNYRPGFTYADFAKEFTAEFYDSDHWADVFSASGAGYVVLTTKHHEGFCNWPTKVSFNWNSMHVGPKRDLVGELEKSIRKRTTMKFGLYHSLFEWYNPLFLQDKNNSFKTRNYVDHKSLPELKELVENYKPDLIWSDGDPAPVSYWNSTGFLAWLYNDSPVKDTVVTNDRWGVGTSCKHGGYYTCYDRYQPGKKLNHKWENCMTVDKNSWGYRRNSNLEDYLSTHEIISTLVETVSCGGNMLMNVGPTHDGRIMPIFEQRLRELGSWLKVNGPAIYGTVPWTNQNDSMTKDVWYTQKRSTFTSSTIVYAIVLKWPNNGLLFLADIPNTQETMIVKMVGVPYNLPWKPAAKKGIVVMLSSVSFDNMPSTLAWSLEFSFHFA